MMCDIDEAFDLEKHLIEPSYMTVEGERHHVLQVMCSLLDESSPERVQREALFTELMCRVAGIGLQVTVPDQFPMAFPNWWDWLQTYCAEKNIVLRTHHPPVSKA